MTADPGMPAGLDAAGQQLWLASQKAQFVASIAQSQQATSGAKAAALQGLMPTLPADAPTGQVTLSGSAGAFGPWRAHQVIDTIAQQVAKRARKQLQSVGNPRVLIVGDPAVLDGDWTAGQVRDTLDRLATRITSLSAQLVAGQETLQNGINDYREAEKEAAKSLPKQPTTSPLEGVRRSDEVTTEPPAPTSPAPAAGAAAGGLGAAVDLLSLLRTDYTLTASTVTPGASEIMTLTAVHLAQPLGCPPGRPIAVEVDGFTTARSSPSAASLRELLKNRDLVMADICELEQVLAPVTAELTAITATKAVLDQEWSKAAAAQTGTAQGQGQGAPYPAQLVAALAQWEVHREAVAGPAGALRDYAKQVVADVDAGVTTLLQAPAGGQAPLYTAVRRERLAADAPDPITHVLYLTADCVAADVVTRRTLLGSSGTLRFLAAATASWQLMDTATGQIVAGGQQSPASVMTYSLSSGNAAYSVVPHPQGKGTSLSDPLTIAEWVAKGLVVVLALVVAALGVVSVLAVIHGAFPKFL